MDSTIKSKRSTERVYVRFINKSGRPASVYWVDFEGAEVFYSTLELDAYIDINTFVDHPWVFKDKNTKDRLVVNNELYFFPPSWKDLFRKTFGNSPENIPQHRIIVMITLPVYSLRERCLQVVRNECLAGNVERCEILKHVEELLPRTVYNDLVIKLFKQEGFYLS